MKPESHSELDQFSIKDRLEEKCLNAKSERLVTFHRPILPPAVLFSSTQGTIKAVRDIIDIYVA